MFRRVSANLREKRRELEDVEAELAEQSRKLEQAKVERAKLSEQSRAILASFRGELAEPMQGVGKLLLDERLAAILTEAAEGAVDPAVQAGARSDAAAQLEELIESRDASLTQADAVDALYGRFFENREYTKNQFVNLMICLTQSFLTVFSGAPGTGKTSVCSILAQVLGLHHPERPELQRYVPVSVERGWSSKRDFVGYYNPLTKVFDKANSAVYRALELSDAEAELDEERKPLAPPNLILLDEANLSPMEHYWADFMMAAGEFDERRGAAITLSERDRFRIASTLRFVATINNDHTTENLSPRLIDRAWVVTLPEPKSVRAKRLSGSYAPIPMGVLREHFDLGAGDVDPDGFIALDPSSEAILAEVFASCREALDMSVSPRLELALRRYCAVGGRLFEPEQTEDGEIPPEVVALDYAVAQKILPKVQGSGPAYRRSLSAFGERLRAKRLMQSARLVDSMLRRGERNMEFYQFFG